MSIVALVTILACFTSIRLFNGEVFSPYGASTTYPTAEWSSLVRDSTRLWASANTDWGWQRISIDTKHDLVESDPAVLMTLVFSGQISPADIPQIEDLNLSVTPVPRTQLSSTSDTTLAFSVPYSEAHGIFSAIQELPIRDRHVQSQEEWASSRRKKTWKVASAESNRATGIASWASNSWAEFVGLINNATALDIILMALGYILMHLTFVALFVSMRRLGSRFLLATSVLVSSSFAFLFALLTTTEIFHVPITLRLLSEGLPFFVVVIGFEKPILLSQSVFSHAIEHNRPKDSLKVVQYAIEAATHEKGLEITITYAIEILVLVAGVSSNIEGGLRPFCFLAAWILFFDYILLFLFYTPILCIKLELNRVKRQVEIRRLLEDDGISHRVADNVAQSLEPGNNTVFGRQIRDIGKVPRFKIFIIVFFALAGVANMVVALGLSSSSMLRSDLSAWSREFGRVPRALDPFEVSSNGLNFILNEAKMDNREVVITVLAPIKYELKNVEADSNISVSSSQNPVSNLLGSLENPGLNRWIIVALSLSVIFNGYLFNVTRWSIRDGDNTAEAPSNWDDLSQPDKARDADVENPRIMQPRPAVSPFQTDESAQYSTPILRSETEMYQMLQDNRASELSDEEIVWLSLRGKIPGYALEKTLDLDFDRAVRIRRAIVSRSKVSAGLVHLLENSDLPYENYDWSQVFGACCENVIGYMPLPVGVAGPLVIDGKTYFIPMATTEGVLVASASRGAKAINAGGGAVTVLTSDGMTRGPCVGFKSLERAGAAKLWLDSEDGQKTLKGAFNSTSRFARLQSTHSTLAGTMLFIRFRSTTGDAMGMNMISKGVEHALNVMKETAFDDMDIVTLTGNYCSDKKPSAINWIEGRGKGVVAEATIPAEAVKRILKTDVESLVTIFVNKNMIGSAMAGSIGGFNAQAANLVAAIFLATGQDPAQVVESANCITIMKNVGGALQISVSMPSIEVGTLGGGTILDPQGAMLEMLGVKGPHPIEPGANAQRLARIIAAATLAGELSLCSALAAGHLVSAHMQHNRSTATTRANTPAPASVTRG
ncbi:hypothetical protein FDECE_1655 [Fusarium decemcellulare]|nr:hypothetical protein FDECE_1655 [Fusarium decemcellulare]